MDDSILIKTTKIAIAHETNLATKMLLMYLLERLISLTEGA
jgi:hypothetical protein